MARRNFQMAGAGDSQPTPEEVLAQRTAALQALSWNELRTLAQSRGVTTGSRTRAAIEADLLAQPE